MENWKGMAARLKARLAPGCARLRAWLRTAWTQLRQWLAPLWARLADWAKAHRERLVPAAELLGASLVVFLALVLTMPGPAARVAGRYLDAAFHYDYMGLYSLFDDRVLSGELARYGLDREGMAARAGTNSSQLEEYVADIERRYGVEISFSHKVSGQRSLDRVEREELEARYAADGIAVELRDARRVSAQVDIQLVHGDQTQTLPRELEVTAIATPRGWSLDRDSMYAFLDIIYDLPGSVQAVIGT